MTFHFIFAIISAHVNTSLDAEQNAVQLQVPIFYINIQPIPIHYDLLAYMYMYICNISLKGSV